MTGKAIIVSAPSGAGKTTIVKYLLKSFPELAFSVSACSRQRRPGETDGRDYFFISGEEFRKKIANEEFIEWEQVYPGSYYGTLKSDVERIWKEGKNVIFDVDVAGGLNLKKYFREKGLAIFIQPPSHSHLEQRLKNRNTETPESIEIRLNKAKHELEFAGKFDRVIVNDELTDAVTAACNSVRDFLSA
jgi:guanylate kinase